MSGYAVAAGRTSFEALHIRRISVGFDLYDNRSAADRGDRVARVRRKLENFFLKNASGLVEDMSELQGGRLADALEDLEARSARAAVAEVRAAELERRIARFGPAYEDDRTQIEHFLSELEDRDTELAELRPRLENLETQLALSVVELEERDRRLADHASARDDQEARIRELTDVAASAGAAVERAEAARQRAESALRAFENTERERARASLEIGRQRTALADREGEIARRELALARLVEREREIEQVEARLAERERKAAERDAEAAESRLAAMTAQTRLEVESRRLAELEASLETEARVLVARESDLDDRTAPPTQPASPDARDEAREVLEQLRSIGARRDRSWDGDAPDTPGGPAEHGPWPAPAAG
jgi:chromosome segregation ATPase